MSVMPLFYSIHRKQSIGQTPDIGTIDDLRTIHSSFVHILDGSLEMSSLQCLLSPIGKLTALEKLELAENRIEQITSLSTLEKLRNLNLRNNRITDIASLFPLAGAAINLYGNDQIPCNQLEKFARAFKPKQCRK